MKFAKYLVENSVPEWRLTYINYSKLKKFIKNCRFVRGEHVDNYDRLESPYQSNEGINHIHANPGVSATVLGSAPIDDTVTPPTLIHMKSMNSSSTSIDSHAVAQMHMHPPVLSTQSSANMVDGHADIDMEDGDSYMALVHVTYEADTQFFAELMKQMRKANTFYREREVDARSRLESLREQCRILERVDPKRVLGGVGAASAATLSVDRRSVVGGGGDGSEIRGSSATPNTAITTSDAPNDKTDDHRDKTTADISTTTITTTRASPHHDTRVFVATTNYPRHSLRKAVLEYYRLLELLKNFKILNEMAVRKIIKKFEKGTHVNTSQFKAHLKKIHFISSTEIETLLKETETLFAKQVDPKVGDESGARKVLRIPDKSNMASKRKYSNWRSGFMTGVAIPPIIFTLRWIMQTPTWTKQDTLLTQIYGGFSIPIMFLFLFAVCLRIWDAFQINWVLVFELDPRDFLSPYTFSEVASLLLMVFSYCMYFSLVGNPFGLTPYVFPSVFIGVVLAVLVLPIPPLTQAPRSWFWRSLFRIVFSGVFEVQFRDFFLCDMMVSMTYSLVAFENVVCIAVNHHSPADVCVAQKSLSASIATALPTLWRLLQCFRRYHDDPGLHPHLTNSFKYVLALAVISVSTTARITESNGFYYSWIAVSVCAMIYAYAWDVLYDWGLFRRATKPPFLRHVIAYPAWVYYFAIGINAVLRIGCVLLLAPNFWDVFSAQQSIIYLVAVLEIFRRFVWAIIRMENEHSNNIGNFRAVKELPLPFRINMRVNDSVKDSTAAAETDGSKKS